MSKKRIIGLILFILLFIGFLITYYGIVNSNLLEYEKVIVPTFLLFYTFFLYLCFGLKKERETNDYKKIKKTVIIELIIYFIIVYSLGTYLGFTTNVLSFKLHHVVSNLLIPVSVLLYSEIIRYIFINSVKNNKPLIVLITILLIALELMTSINIYNFSDASSVLVFVIISFIPSCIKGIMLTYLSLKTGYKPCIIYRLIIDLYVVIVPLAANLGNYLECISLILFPLIVIFSIYHISNNKGISNIREKKVYLSDIFVLIVFFIFVLLISGITNFSITAIGSESMEPTLKKGDTVIIYRTHDIKVGDIVSFYNNEKNIIHRVVDIDKKYCITKGDNNKTSDSSILYIKDIKGKVIFSIPYIGYPSIWINEKR